MKYKIPDAPLGQGDRFAHLKDILQHKPGIYSPGGLAAKIGRAKLGKKKFQGLAAKGKKSAY